MPLRHVRMVPDDRAVIRDAFAESRARSAVVLATGGLGPTHDDLSREGLADALGEALAEDPELMAELEERFRAFGPMPAANRRQAMLIPSAEAVPNPIGSAPGWWVDRDGVGGRAHAGRAVGDAADVDGAAPTPPGRSASASRRWRCAR